jgi:hypothetical protein
MRLGHDVSFRARPVDGRDWFRCGGVRSGHLDRSLLRFAVVAEVVLQITLVFMTSLVQCRHTLFRSFL